MYFYLPILFFLTDVISDLYHYVNPKTGADSAMISQHVYEIVQNNSEVGQFFYFRILWLII